MPSSARGGRPAAVGQSAREIARLADSMRDDSRGRERTRESDKDRAKERVTVVPPRGSASKERDRERRVSFISVNAQHAAYYVYCQWFQDSTPPGCYVVRDLQLWIFWAE